ncbi:MAG: hypothetical protein LBC73_09245 [Oscillospiraceae bacterium]|nr:hypothetical protein [Oscillospiraceae bacterium]
MPQYRFRLENRNILDINDKKYRILDLISEQGGSCLVYKAELVSDIPSETTFVIKEFYPALDEIPINDIQRGTGGELVIAESSAKLFIEHKMRFCNGVANQIAEIYTNPNTPTLGCPEPHANVNGTAYSVLELGKGDVIQKSDISNFSPSDVIQIMLSLCSQIGKFHVRGRLFLDVKPSNIFLFEKEREIKRQIALFDFDTVFEKGKLPESNAEFE